MTDNREDIKYDITSEEENNYVSIDEAKRACSRIGFGFTAFELLWLIGSIFFIIVLQNVNEDLLGSMWFTYIINYIPMIFIALPVLYIIINRLEVRVPEKRRMKISDFIGSVMIVYTLSIAGSLIGIGVNYLIYLFFGITSSSAVVELLTSGQDTLVTLIFAGITAPIVEEIIFRKLLIDRTIKYGQGLSIVLSGLLFGLIHGNFQQFFYAFLLGMFFAYIYIRTGRLTYTILLHMVLNSVSVFIASLYPAIGSLETMEYSDVVLHLSTASSETLLKLFVLIILVLSQYIFAIIGVILLIVKRKRFVLSENSNQSFPENSYPSGMKRSLIIFKSPGMIICIIVFLAYFIYNMLLV